VVKQPVYHETKICPDCFSTVIQLGRPSLDQWRCCDPLCPNSKNKMGFLVGDELIEKDSIFIMTRSDIISKVALILFDLAEQNIRFNKRDAKINLNLWTEIMEGD